MRRGGIEGRSPDPHGKDSVLATPVKILFITSKYKVNDIEYTSESNNVNISSTVKATLNGIGKTEICCFKKCSR